MNVADDVERSCLVAEVVEQGLQRDRCRGDLIDAVEDVDLAESFFAEELHRSTKLILLALDHVRTELAIGAALVSVDADSLGHIQHDCDGQYIVVARELHEALPRFGLNVRRIDHGEQTSSKTLGCDKSECLKCRTRCGLVVFVVRNQATEEVALEGLERPEVLAGERGFAGSAGPD